MANRRLKLFMCYGTCVILISYVLVSRNYFSGLLYQKNAVVYNIGNDVANKLDYYSNMSMESKVSMTETKNIQFQTDEAYQSPYPGPYHEIPLSKIYVFSAFYDRPRGKSGAAGVRAVGLAPMKLRHANFTEVFCHVTFDDVTVEVISGRIIVLGNPTFMTSQLRLCSIYLECNVTQSKWPLNVSFSMDNSEPSKGHAVIYPKNITKRTFIVCYSVLFNSFNDRSMLQQSIEFNRLMGAQHFYIYVRDIGPQVEALLSFYTARGLLTILYVPERPSRSAWYNGQTTVVHDCHCRARYTAHFIVVQDIDEYITPLLHTSWAELLTSYKGNNFDLKSDPDANSFKQGRSHDSRVFIHSSQTSRLVIKDKVVYSLNNHFNHLGVNLNESIAFYSFRHAFYISKPLDDFQWEKLKIDLSLTAYEVDFINTNQVRLFLNMNRNEFHDYPARVKSIYRPEMVIESGIHYPLSVLPGSQGVAVDTSLAILAHHREGMAPGMTEGFPEYRVSSYFRKYLDLLIQSNRDFDMFISSNGTVFKTS